MEKFMEHLKSKTLKEEIFKTAVVAKQFTHLPEDFNKVLAGLMMARLHELDESPGTKEGYQKAGNVDAGIFDTSNHDYIKMLENMFNESFKELFNHFHPEDNRDISDCIRNCSRITVMREGDFKRLHTHSGTDAYGIYYVDVGDANEDNGVLELEDPKMLQKLAFTEAPVVKITPQDSMMVVAPSYIRHRVTPYSGHKERIAIVCNLILNNDEDIEDQLQERTQQNDLGLKMKDL
jgi:hypothetical protein